MKKISLMLVFVLMFTSSVFAAPKQVVIESGMYEVPVYLKHFHQDKESMGNIGIRKFAKVAVRDGKATYTIYGSKMPLGKIEGELTNLFVHKSSGDSEKVEARKSEAHLEETNTIKGKKFPYTKAFTFTRDRVGESKVVVSMWIDAMDQLQGGKPGAGEQKAVLVFDWFKAKKADGNNATVDLMKERASDVPANHWAVPAIKYTLEKGYFKGVGNGKFLPNGNITRGQFLTVIGRILNVDKTKYNGTHYSDVKEGMYYTPYINWARANSMYHNEGGKKFMPNQPLTREEMAYIMNSYVRVGKLNLKDVKFDGFKDEKEISGWAKEAVNNIAKKGIVQGDQGKYDPKGTFTRAQVAQVLYNLSK